jgi:hypothetical protein
MAAASSTDVDAAEVRLGLRLPPTYRRAMMAGTELPGDHGLTLLAVSAIDRFARREPEWLGGWMSGIELGAGTAGDGAGLADDPADPATAPSEDLAETVVISTTADERVLLLNPRRIHDAGEWEAWDFATWYPGAYRYPSFAALVDALRDG